MSKEPQRERERNVLDVERQTGETPNPRAKEYCREENWEPKQKLFSSIYRCKKRPLSLFFQPFQKSLNPKLTEITYQKNNFFFIKFQCLKYNREINKKKKYKTKSTYGKVQNNNNSKKEEKFKKYNAFQTIKNTTDRQRDIPREIFYGEGQTQHTE